MSEPATDAQVAAWRRDWGEHCPFCGAAYFEVEVTKVPDPRLDSPPGELRMYEHCDDCGRRWIAVLRDEPMPVAIEEIADE